MSDRHELCYEFGPFRIDLSERILLCEGVQVPLTLKAFDMLLLLVERSGHIVEKDVLMRALWPDSFVEEANLTVIVSALRKALGESPARHQYIETIPRRGYRFVAKVKKPQGEARDSVAEDQARPEAAAKSLAVLPFKPLSAESGDAYLGLGIADTLITMLSNIRQVIVRPTSAVRKYTSLEQDSTIIGQELQVEFVLEGSIQKSGERLRVTVQLVRVLDGVPLWADRFNEDFTDMFTVQDRVAEQAAKALMLKLSGDEERQLLKRFTGNIEAHQLYQKGRYFWNKSTEEGYKKAIEYFNRAIEKDPHYALAYAGLSDAYAMLSTYGLLPPRVGFPQAEDAALKALAIDGTLAEAHTSLGAVYGQYHWDLLRAETEYKLALELSPNYSIAHQWYGWCLLAMGRFTESIAEMRRATELNPVSLMAIRDLGMAFIAAGQCDQAIEHFYKILEMDQNFAPAHIGLGWAYWLKGGFEKSVEAFERAIRLFGDAPFILAAIGQAYAVSGNRERALRILDQLSDLAKRTYIPPFDIAVIYAWLGKQDQALEWLEKAYEERDSSLVYLNYDPRLKGHPALFSDARFTDLLRRINSQENIHKLPTKNL